jgi:hypothetical protein
LSRRAAVLNESGNTAARRATRSKDKQRAPDSLRRERVGG